MPSPLILQTGDTSDREKIYALRHDIYAAELGQHQLNAEQQLSDDLDKYNHYIVGKYDGEITGFISITPPSAPKYSVDKYFDRCLLPFSFDEELYEIRLLTVLKNNRYSQLAFALMYAAFRWVQSHGGKNIVAICREDLAKMYVKAGMKLMDHKAGSGRLVYQLAATTTKNLEFKVQKNPEIYQGLEEKINWQLPYSFFPPSACYHGGSFFKAIGEDLQHLEKSENIINADVLDAWFPPSPKVLDCLKKQLSFLLKTSPPTYAVGLIKEISRARNIREASILPGAGSSDLIFLALRELLNNNSRVLITDPCYGEYIHVLEKIIKCKVDRFDLSKDESFKINSNALLKEIAKGYDVVILVNPNSPTGTYTSKEDMQNLLLQIPDNTLIWIDETYIDFVDSRESLEQFATTRENVIICKSMSKAYALSGIRVAYLCASPHLIEGLRALSPPWAVSLPAQAAAIAALKDQKYYSNKYAETARFRETLIADLKTCDIDNIIGGVANFILFYRPAGITTPKFISDCQDQQLFLRDVSNMGKNIGDGAVRVAVKDADTNKRIINIIRNVLENSRVNKTPAQAIMHAS